VVRLYNASDAPRQARISSGLLTILSAQLADLAEHPTRALTMADGEVIVTLPARQVTTINLAVQEQKAG
jgi:hypothetical protein